MNLPHTAAVDQGHWIKDETPAIDAPPPSMAITRHRLLHPQRHPPPSGTSATIRDVCSTAHPLKQRLQCPGGVLPAAWIRADHTRHAKQIRQQFSLLCRSSSYS